MSQTTMLATDIRVHRGTPTLFINEAPCTGLTFFFGRAGDAPEDIAAFARAGIDLYSGCFGLGDCFCADGSYDFSAVDRQYARVIAANPRVRILPRVGVGRWHMPPALREARTGEMQVDLLPDGTPCPNGGHSFSSEIWLQEGLTALRAYIHHCETTYGSHILGYHLGAGASGEWSYSWHTPFSDYSPAQQAAFRTWLRRRYGDEHALRAAWGREDASFDRATIPSPAQRARGTADLSLFDPRREREVIDYLTFHSEAVASALVRYCGAAKEALRELGRQKIVGAFYGYQFKNLNVPGNFHNTGHFAQQMVLDSPDVDFLCGPYCYQGREHGHMYLPQLATGSVRLRGKLSWCEDDTFTFLAKREPHRSWCPDRASSIGVLRRNLAGILREGGTAWWMDCGGNGPLVPGGQVEGWYRDEALMANFSAMQRLAARRLEQGDYTPTSQVAVFVSDGSAVYQRQDSALMDALIMRQMFEVAALGASFDIYRLADIGLLLAQPWSWNYRLLLFLDAISLSDTERRVLREQAQQDGRTLIWNYAAGLAGAEGFSPEAMAEATGIRVALRQRNEPLLVTTFATGTRLLYGTERPIGPVLYGDDPAAEVQGWLLNSADPGLLIRQYPAWRAIWSAAPALPAALLRRFAREAGVHLYVETGEQVLVDGNLLTLHAGFSGERIVHLPAPCDLADAYTGTPIASGVCEFAATLQRGETATWLLSPVTVAR